MMGMSAVEFGILLILFGSQGNLGVPLGVPPAEEVQLMSDVAPEDCLFYAAWATAGTPDPEINPSERWLAQPKIQAAWTKLQTHLLDPGLNEGDFDQPFEQALTELSAKLCEQSIRRATAIFVENGDRWKSLRGGCVIQLEPAAVQPIAAAIARLKNALPPSWNPRELTVEGNTYLSMQFDELEVAVGLRGQFAIVGFGPDAIANIEQRVRTPEPAWLTELKHKLPVERRCSISHLALADGFAILKQSPETEMPEEAKSFLGDVLRVDTLQAFDSVCGLDSQGFVSRHRLTIRGEELVGLASILDTDPLSDDDLRRLVTGRDLTTGIRLSIPDCLSLIDQGLKLAGESFDEPKQEFQSQFGLRLVEDVLDHFDGSLLIQANLDSGDPTSGFLVQLGLADEMSFFDSFQTFNDKLREIIETSDASTTFVEQERGGIPVYSVHFQNDFGFIPEPQWFLQGGRLCIGLDRETIDKRIGGGESPLIDDEQVQQVLGAAGQAGLQNPLGFSRVEMSALIKMLMSFSSMWGLGLEGGPIQLSDLPPTEVLVNGLEPSIGLLFRTREGFEIYGRQTIPSAAPGATLAAAGVLTVPSIVRIRAAANLVDSRNRMRQILIAMHDYHDACGAFPAQCSQDKNGKPLLSWRVHILPYIEENELYQQFHLDEPWDSEHNLKLVERMPEVFRHPKLELEPGHTAYLGLRGKETIWRAPKDAGQPPTGVTLESIASLDGTSQTAALIEVPRESAVIWTKPDDLDVDPSGFSQKLKAVWSKGINVGMSDASVFTYKADLSEDQWRTLFGYRDGQSLDLDQLRSER